MDITPQKKQSPAIYIATVLFGLLALGGGTLAYLMYQQNVSLKNQVASLQNSNNSQTTHVYDCSKVTTDSGFKLFESKTYNWCIEYPNDWPVHADSASAAKVTFGSCPATAGADCIPPYQAQAGWLSVTAVPDETSATYATKIKARYIEPAGPCTDNSATVAGMPADKVVCKDAIVGNNQVYLLFDPPSGNYLYAQKFILVISYTEGDQTLNSSLGKMANSLVIYH